jgi:hypothetical protein
MKKPSKIQEVIEANQTIPRNMEEGLSPLAPEPQKTEAEILIEKAGLITNLLAVCQSAEIKNVILSQPNGKKVYEIFTTAISKEMNAVMSGKGPETQVQALSAQFEQMAKAMGNFNHIVTSFMNSRLIDVLTAISTNLKGGRTTQNPQVDESQKELQEIYQRQQQAGMQVTQINSF